jgi:hypothetical protein
MLRELAPDLWVTERPLRFVGIEVGTRMTTIRLADGSLFLHSPVPLDAELRSQLDEKGHVRFAVAPNRFHHLFAGEVRAAYPDAKLYAAPGLEKKRTDVAWDGVLGDEPAEGWAGQIEQVFFRGFPFANEVAFCHPASRTLITADLVFNIGPESAALTRTAFRLAGSYGRVATTALERFGIRDRLAASASLERILAWDFERLIVAHGRVQESGGREALRSAYAWLLRSGR